MNRIGWNIAKGIVSMIAVILFLIPFQSVQAGYTGPNRLPGDPPAGVSGSVVGCGGSNGWCSKGSYVFITGSEPVSGYAITAIEGYHNGAGFSCGGPTCQVNLVEGANTLTFWAVSNYPDTSSKGSISVRVDSKDPNITLSLPEPNGLNDWYVSSVSVSVDGSDDRSGVSKKLVGIDGGGWFANNITILEDGYYRINAAVYDVAGNSAGRSVSIKIDQTPPLITYRYPEPDGKDAWYVTPLYIEASAQDALSGMSDLQIMVDHAEPDATYGDTKEERTGLFNRSAVIQTDGYHQVTIRSFDIAGNQQDETFNLKVDTTPPVAKIESPTSMSKTITMQGMVADELSGIEHVFINRGNGWIFVEPENGWWSVDVDTMKGDVQDGYFTFGLKVYDKAGNVIETSRRVLVLNHSWPFYTLIALSLALGLIALLDPRPAQWRKLAIQLRKMRGEFFISTTEVKK